ncbi:MAG: tetratricopeptide repeat protein [Candidatus Brocadiales bacterium]
MYRFCKEQNNLSKEKIGLSHFIGPILTVVLLIAILNQGCGKPQESKVEQSVELKQSETSKTHPPTTPTPTQTESTSQPVAAKKTVANDANGHFNLGIESAKMGKLNEAIKEWEKAVDMDPKFIKAHNYLARSYYTNERFDDALNEYKKIVELDPANAMAQVSIGFVYRIKRMHDEAIAACNNALQINPQLASAYHCIGKSYVDKKMYTKAIDAYKRAITINPNHADAYFELGIAFESDGRIEEAKQAFQAFDALKDKSSPSPGGGHGH